MIVDLNVVVFVFPLLEKKVANVAVKTAGEEGENGSPGRGLAAEKAVDLACYEVDLRERSVFCWVESFWGVGVA